VYLLVGLAGRWRIVTIPILCGVSLIRRSSPTDVCRGSTTAPL